MTISAPDAASTAAAALDIPLAALLAPIGTDAPAGANLREDFSTGALYYKLRDARAEARAAERAADTDAGETPPPAEWRTVRQAAVEALRDKTKDLEIAAWLTEALVRERPLAGLTIGATLLAGLADAYWETGLLPLPDEDGLETRVAPVTGLNGEGGDGTLMQPLRKLAFYRRPDGSGMPFYLYDAAMNLQAETDAARRKQRLAAGVPAPEAVAAETSGVGPGWFSALRREVTAAAAAWTALALTFEAKAGRAAPPTARVRDLLADMIRACNRHAPPEADDPALSGEDTLAEADALATLTADAAAPAAPRNVESRDDMLAALTRIAAYFRRTEPHSPLAYTLDEAVRRARLTWPELLAEIVPEEPVRNALLVKLGIKPPTP